MAVVQINILIARQGEKLWMLKPIHQDWIQGWGRAMTKAVEYRIQDYNLEAMLRPVKTTTDFDNDNVETTVLQICYMHLF